MRVMRDNKERFGNRPFQVGTDRLCWQRDGCARSLRLRPTFELAIAEHEEVHPRRVARGLWYFKCITTRSSVMLFRAGLQGMGALAGYLPSNPSSLLSPTRIPRDVEQGG